VGGFNRRIIKNVNYSAVCTPQTLCWSRDGRDPQERDLGKLKMSRQTLAFNQLLHRRMFWEIRSCRSRVEQTKAPRPEPDLGAKQPVFNLGHAPLSLLLLKSAKVAMWLFMKKFKRVSAVSDIQRFSRIDLCGTAIAF
jgi:hypothetical protein